MAKKAKAAKAVEKKAHANPYKEGSRKRQIYDVFLDSEDSTVGLKKAYALADKLGIKEGTVKSWSGGWLKGETKPKPKDPGDKPAKSEVVHEKGFHPEFKYTSRARADQRHESLCTSSGLRPHAFHVLEEDGRFAVVPANFKPPGPVPTFEKGDVVYDAFIANTKAKVLEAGPEQTLIRYVKDRGKGPREECVINRFLVKLPDNEKKLKRERL